MLHAVFLAPMANNASSLRLDLQRWCKLFVSMACPLQEHLAFVGVCAAVPLSSPLAIYLLLCYFRNSGENACTASNACRVTIFCYTAWLFDGSRAFRPVHNSERYISSLVAQKLSLFSECTDEYMILCAACQVPEDLTSYRGGSGFVVVPSCLPNALFPLLLFWSKTTVHFSTLTISGFYFPDRCQKAVLLALSYHSWIFCVYVRAKWLTPVYGVYAASAGDVSVCVCPLLLTMYRSCVPFIHSRPVFFNLLGKWWN